MIFNNTLPYGNPKEIGVHIITLLGPHVVFSVSYMG